MRPATNTRSRFFSLTPTLLASALTALAAPAPTANAQGGTIINEVAKLIAADGAAQDNFGVSVALSGDTAVVGASGDDDNGTHSGSAYIFVRDASALWTQQAKLLPLDGAANNFFGLSVAISGDSAIIGAPFDDDKR